MQKPFKVCRKGLHQYSSELKRCPECTRKTCTEKSRRRRARLPDYDREWIKGTGYKHQKAWKARNKDRVNSYTRKRQASIKTTEIEFVDYAVVINLANGICQLCNKPFGTEKVEIDHIVPLSVGGAHTYQNVQATHASCNRRKGVKHKIF